MKNFTILALICFSATLFSCNESKKETGNFGKQGVMLTIASKQVDCTGVIPQKCYLIKQEGEQDWTYFYNTIEGFSYTPGYEYTLEVKIDTIVKANPVADQFSLLYTLIKEVSKVEKESANMP